MAEDYSYMQISDTTMQLIVESIPIVLTEGREDSKFSLDDFIATVYTQEDEYKSQREEADGLKETISGLNRVLAKIVLCALPKSTKQQTITAYTKDQDSDSSLNHNMAYFLKEMMWRADTLFGGDVHKYDPECWLTLKNWIGMSMNPSELKTKLEGLMSVYSNITEIANKKLAGKRKDAAYHKSINDALYAVIIDDAKLYALANRLSLGIINERDPSQTQRPDNVSIWVFDILSNVKHYLDDSANRFTFISNGIFLEDDEAYATAVKMLKALTRGRDLSGCEMLDQTRISCMNCEKELAGINSRYPDLSLIGTRSVIQAINNDLQQFVFAYRLFNTEKWHELGKAMLENIASEEPTAPYVLRTLPGRIEVHELSRYRLTSPFVRYFLEQLSSSKVEEFHTFERHPNELKQIIEISIESRNCMYIDSELYREGGGVIRNTNVDKDQIRTYLTGQNENVPPTFRLKMRINGADTSILCIDNHLHAQVDIRYIDMCQKK